MMLFTLGGIFKSVIALFKTRVLADGGTFEAETNLENLLNDYYIFYSDRENVSFVQECYRAFYGNKNLQSKIYYKEFGPREPVLLLNKENTFNRKMVNFLCYRTKEFIPMNEMIKQSYLKK